MYSGYLNPTPEENVFYTLSESGSKDPSKDPLMMVIAGGPGASAVAHFFGMGGPLTYENQQLLESPDYYRGFNLLFIDSPFCVGFTFRANNSCENNDDTTVSLHTRALASFVDRHPEYKGRDLYILGMSYGGLHTMLLASRLLDSNDKLFNVKGFVKMNGLTNWNNHRAAVPSMLFYRSVISERDFKNFMTQCCVGVKPKDCYWWANGEMCNAQMDAAKQVASYMDYDGTDPSVSAAQFENYMNSAAVLEALHAIPKNGAVNNIKRYQVSSFIVTQKYKWQYATKLRPMYERLFKKFPSGDFKLLSLNGARDIAQISDLSQQWFFDEFNAPIVKGREPWFYEARSLQHSLPGGFITKYKYFTMATVEGAGHAPIVDKPEAVTQIIQRFLLQ